MPLHKHEAEKLIDTIRGFIADEKKAPLSGGFTDGLPGGKRGDKAADIPPPPARAAASNGNGDLPSGKPFDEEALYQRFRERFINEAKIDPVLLKLIMVQPEIIVEYERKTEQLDTSTLRGRIAGLIARGFFDDAKTTGNVNTELTRTGSKPNSGGLSTALQTLLVGGFLTRAGDAWVKAPGVKVSDKQIETGG